MKKIIMGLLLVIGISSCGPKIVKLKSNEIVFNTNMSSSASTGGTVFILVIKDTITGNIRTIRTSPNSLITH